MRPWDPSPVLAVALASVFLLVLAGCGSDNGTAAETVPRLTKAQLLKKGLAICDHGNKEIAVGLDPIEKRRTASGRIATAAELQEDVVQVVLPVRRIELRRLRALGMPKEGARQFQTMLDATQEGIEKGERNPSLLLAKKVFYAFREASEVGIRFGLVSCWLG